MNKKPLNILFLILTVGMSLFASVVLSGCGLGCDVDTYKETVMPFVYEWSDALELPQTTGTSRSAQIGRLEIIALETSKLEVQECFVEDHKLLLEGMDLQIAGLRAWFGNSSDTEIQVLFDKAEYNIIEWEKAINSK